MRIGIIGFGLVAQHTHAAYYQHEPSIEIVAVCDSSRDRLSVASSYFPSAELYEFPDEMFDGLDAQIDAVDICTPPYIHYELTRAALSRGYNVVCEKPLTTNVEQAERLLGLAQKQDLVVYPCHNYLFSSAVLQAKNAIMQGKIGTPRQVIFQVLRTAHANGAATWLPDWRRHSVYSGGGILADHGPHNIYLAQYLLGDIEPNKVSCVTAQVRTVPLADFQPHPLDAAIHDRDPLAAAQDSQASWDTSAKDGHFDTEDTAQLEVIYDQDRRASIFLSWASAERSTRRLILGTAGYIALTESSITIVHRGGREQERIDSETADSFHSGWFTPMFIDFQKRVQSADSAYRLKPLLDAYAVAAVISASYISARNESKWMPIVQANQPSMRAA